MTDRLAGPGVRAVLIGTGAHTDSLLTDVASVRTSIHDLGRALVERCGLAEEHLVIIEDPPGPREVLIAVRDAGRAAHRVLLVVYVGHGLIARDQSLYLATAGTSTLDLAIADHQAIRYAALAGVVGDSAARLTVVVLDCCFSGRADPPTPHGHLITSAAGDGVALAPEGARHTEFTGAMIDFLRDGDPGAPPQLTLDHLYRYLWRGQTSATPRRQSGDLSADLVLTDNPAYVPVPPRRPHEPAPPIGMCPYRGFSAYTTEDERFYRGRTELTNDLVRRAAGRLWERDPLVVIGPSGAGKTSLLHAGLLPAIDRGELGVPGSSGWSRVVLHPGPTPLATLTALLAGVDGRFVLIVDQFEQLFTLCQDEAERAAYVRLLTTLAHGTALVVLGVRADFYGQCARFPELVRALQDTLVVGPMTVDELRAAITEPAELAGLEVGPELVGLLLREIDVDRPGGRLPLLSHALQATWGQQENRMLTADGYLRTGGIAGAAERTGDAVYAAFPESEQDSVRQVLLAMVLPQEGGSDVVRRMPVAELLAVLDDQEVGRRVLGRLADARLVTVDDDSAEITHEALLRSWPRLREWIDADREWLRARQRIQADAQAWRNSRRDTSLLYRGANLTTARARAGAPGRERQLGATGTEFLATSARHARRGVFLRRTLVALLVVLTLVAAGTAGLALNQRSAAVGQRTIAEQERDLALSREVATDSENLGDSDPSVSALLSVAAWRLAPTAEARAALLQSASRAGVASIYPGAPGDPAVTFTPDGRTLVTAAGAGVSRWHADSGTEIGTPTTFGSDSVVAAALSPDGTRLAADLRPRANSIAPGTIEVWNLITGQITAHPDDPMFGTATLVFSPDGTMLAAADGNSSAVMVWRADTGAVVAQIPGSYASPQGVRLAFGPNRTLAVDTNALLRSTSDQGGVQLWHLDAPTKPTVELADSFDTMTSIAFDATGTKLATADVNGEIRLWHADTGAALGAPLATLNDEVHALAFNSAGTMLAAGDINKAVRIWQVNSGQQVGPPLVGAGGAVTHLAFSPDGRTLASSDSAGGVRLWRPFGRTPFATMTGHVGPVFSIAYGPSGAVQANGDRVTILVSGGDDGTIRRWNAATGKAIGPPQPDPGDGEVTALAFSPDGGTLAIGDQYGNVELSHGTDDLLAGSAFHQSAGVGSLSFSRDGRELAAVADCAIPGGSACPTGNAGSDAGLWDTGTATAIGPLSTPDEDAIGHDVYSVAFSPTRDVLVGGTFDNVVWWNSHTRQIGPHPVADFAYRVLFAPNGDTVYAVVGQNGNTIVTYDGISGTQHTILSMPARVNAIAVSPDSTVLAAGMGNSTIQLYHLPDFQPLGPALATGASADSIAFDHTGRQLAVGLENGVIQLWDVRYAVDPVGSVCAATSRSLTQLEWNRYIPAGPAYRQVCP